ncbi:MAG TPA: AI-2E family transporter [Geminicoccaceae bacterium]
MRLAPLEQRMSPSTRRIEWFAAVVALTLLVVGCVVVLRPFFTALLWALVLAFSSWPVYARLESRLGHRRTLAAVLMAVLLAAGFVLPLAFLSTTIAEHATSAIDLVRSLLDQGPPEPPAWVVNLPVIGQDAAQTWHELAADSERFAELMRPYLAQLRGWAIASGLAVGAGVAELTLSLVVAFFLFRDGYTVADQADLLGRRLIGDRVQHIFQVAGSTVRGVVYGVIGTSLIQAVLATVAYAIVGAPGVLFLGFITFFLAFVPSGPPLVWVPLAIWLISNDATGWAVFLAVWGVVVIGSVDHFLKPVLISRESKMPLLLVFFGILGGALAFGVIGVFLGPTLLAVAFALLRDWIALVRHHARGADAAVPEAPAASPQTAAPAPARQPAPSV